MNESGLKKSHFYISRRKNAEKCVPTNHENQFTTKPSIHVLSFTSTICYSAVFIKRLVGDRLCARYWGSIQK